MAFQGVYLLTSIGLNLTSHTEYYPAGTFAALAVGLGGRLILMPRYGNPRRGAWRFSSPRSRKRWCRSRSHGASIRFSYEWGRLVRVVAAGVVAALAGLWLVPPWPPLAGLITRHASDHCCASAHSWP
jgi:hypothetical protein